MAKFPNKIMLHFSDGSTAEFKFKEPKQSPSGRMNAHAGGKYICEDGEKYQIGCNFTLCLVKPKKETK